MVKRSNKVITAIVIILIVLFGIPVLFVLGVWMFYCPDVGKVKISTSIDITSTVDGTSKGNATSTGNEVSTEGMEYTWYETIENAKKDKSIIQDSIYFEQYPSFVEHPFFTYETDDRIVVFYYKAPSKKQKKLSTGFCLSFLKKGRDISQPYYISMVFLKQKIDRCTYDLCDLASEEISDQISFMPIKDFVSMGGYRAYCGEWDNYEELSSLTIDGNTVNEIIPIEVEGKTYYFWYYDKSDLQDNLSAIDFSNYTLDEVTAALNLQYTPAQVEEQ